MSKAEVCSAKSAIEQLLEKVGGQTKWEDLLDEETEVAEHKSTFTDESKEDQMNVFEYDFGAQDDGEEEEEEEEEDLFLADDFPCKSPISVLSRSKSFEQPLPHKHSSKRVADTLEMVLDVSKTGKPQSEFQFVELSKRGLEHGLNPSIVECFSEGTCYYLRSERGLSAVFKPLDEEPGSPRSQDDVFKIMRHGVPNGHGYVREVAAYLLDHGNFAGVPPTALVRVYSKIWRETEEEEDSTALEIPCLGNIICSSQKQQQGSSSKPLQIPQMKNLSNASRSLFTSSNRLGLQSRPTSLSVSYMERSLTLEDDEEHETKFEGLSSSAPCSPSKSSYSLPSKLGSIQAYVSHHSSADDIGFSLLPLESIQRVGILDIRLVNLDRHGGNILLQTVEKEIDTTASHSVPHRRFTRRSESFSGGSLPNELRLVPIDHGLCLPKITELSRTADSNIASDAECIVLEWMNWPQSKQPFLPSVLAYIDRLDAEKDVQLLQTALENAFGVEELLTLRVSTALLKTMARKGRTLHDIGRFIQSGSLKDIVDGCGLEWLKSGFPEGDEISLFMGRFQTCLDARLS